MSDTTNKTFRTLYHRGRLTVAFAWFDLWIGLYFDYTAKIVYWCPVPMIILAWKYGGSSPGPVVPEWRTP